MKRKLLQCIHIQRVFNNKHHVFRSKVKTADALVNCITDVNIGLNKGTCVSDIFSDIKKQLVQLTTIFYKTNSANEEGME